MTLVAFACKFLDRYCVGGFNGQKRVSSVEIFEPRLNVWMMGEPMKFARGDAAAAVLGNSLFAIGGIDDEKEIVDTVCRFLAQRYLLLLMYFQSQT